MPLDSPVFAFQNRMLKPVRPGTPAPLEAVNLVPGTYKSGTIVGQVTTAANDVQSIATSGVPTGGTFTLVLEFPIGNKQTTAPIAWNASAATVQAALVALPNVGSGNVACTGGALPTAVVATFGGLLGNRPVPVLTLGTNSLTGGTTPSVAVTHTTTGVTGGEFKAYASGNSDGSQTPLGVLAIDCYVDSSGFVTFSSTSSDTATGGLWGEKHLTAPVYYGGAFSLADLTGLDANAVTKLSGRFAVGSLSAGTGVFVF